MFTMRLYAFAMAVAADIDALRRGARVASYGGYVDKARYYGYTAARRARYVTRCCAMKRCAEYSMAGARFASSAD